MEPNGDLQFIEGSVERVVFTNPETGYGVVDLLPFSTDERVKVAGILGLVAVDDTLRIAGGWVEHKRFGLQFQAKSAIPVSPKSEFGIFRYLTGPRVQGIGPEFARRIIEKFGAQVFEVLDQTPERLREVEGIGKKRAKKIMRTWQTDAGRREGLVFLHTYGVGPALAEKILDELGMGALATIRTDPYVMIERVSGVGFKTADNMARALGIAKDAPGRIRAGLIHTLDLAQFEGHLCLPGAALIRDAMTLLEIDEKPIRAVLRDLTLEHRLVIASVPAAGDDGKSYFVYTPTSFMAQQEAADRVRLRLLDEAPKAADHAAIDMPAMLSEEQREAVATLYTARFAILTGGPGVGKTTVLKTLTAAWRRDGLALALACPTGRAAKRLEEVSGLEAKTLHRLLRFDPKAGAFSHDADEPLEADIVVVDESSMLDMALFVHLLRALKPSTRLILVGDADQLPSVGPGRVLGDLIESGAVPVARLTRIFRQDAGSRIVSLAHDVLDGSARPEEIDGGEVLFVDEPDVERGALRLRDLLLEELPANYGLRPFEDIQILTPTNKGVVGTAEINKLIQKSRQVEGARAFFGDNAFCRGDRVMQIKNDYTRELYNGDMGAVVDVIESTATVVCDFDGKTQEYSGKELADIVPAWAISVHKSQGGEFPVVLMALYPQHFMLLRRQVLYTGITRARRLLVIVGSPQSFRQAVQNNKMAQRHGHLAWLVRGIVIERFFPPPPAQKYAMPRDEGSATALGIEPEIV